MIYCKELAAVHKVMNKITGFLLFLLPLTLNYIDIKYSGFVVCAAATAAAVQEQYYVIKGKKVRSNGIYNGKAYTPPVERIGCGELI